MQDPEGHWWQARLDWPIITSTDDFLQHFPRHGHRYGGLAHRSILRALFNLPPREEISSRRMLYFHAHLFAHEIMGAADAMWGQDILRAAEKWDDPKPRIRRRASLSDDDRKIREISSLLDSLSDSAAGAIGADDIKGKIEFQWASYAHGLIRRGEVEMWHKAGRAGAPKDPFVAMISNITAQAFYVISGKMHTTAQPSRWGGAENPFHGLLSEVFAQLSLSPSIKRASEGSYEFMSSHYGRPRPPGRPARNSH